MENLLIIKMTKKSVFLKNYRKNILKKKIVEVHLDCAVKNHLKSSNFK